MFKKDCLNYCINIKPIHYFVESWCLWLHLKLQMRVLTAEKAIKITQTTDWNLLLQLLPWLCFSCNDSGWDTLVFTACIGCGVCNFYCDPLETPSWRSLFWKSRKENDFLVKKNEMEINKFCVRDSYKKQAWILQVWILQEPKKKDGCGYVLLLLEVCMDNWRKINTETQAQTNRSLR